MAIAFSYVKYTELSPKLQTQVEAAALTEFGDVPIVQKYQWAEPTYSFLATQGEALAGSVNLVARKIRWDGKSVDAAGVNNLIVQKRFRKKGFGAELMEKALLFAFREMSAQVAVLFCADDLIPFYEKLGWHKTSAKVVFQQPTKQCEWTSNRMWISNEAKISEPKEIDLCGLPW